ncbi:hypothetical protein THASP1DRAFT_13260, partial [Thamnocephalis sphaerospora]
MSADAHMNIYQPLPREHKNLPGTPRIDYDITNPVKAICGGKPAGPIAAIYAAGSSIDVKIEGSTPHDGGHCQFALSYDGGKTFVVLRDVVGNCITGSREYSVLLPADVPSANNAVFAWAWINATGNREYYMNCADVIIKG